MANDVNLNIFGINFFFNFILIKDKKISILDKLYILQNLLFICIK